ncbi:MAG TPA: hypothetical protein VMA96_18165 [Solirubrobacteraceae bacterium]|nr:hypothetical protein [Solirubrobacteraceae bacterium]
MCVLAVALLSAPAPALADGDPASDVLIVQNVFYPFSPPVAAGIQKTLNAEAAAAKRAHFPIKVALIASPGDLGAIPSLFAKPQQYAAFLDQEISFFGGKQPLLVVMPNGYGVRGLTAQTAAVVARLPPPAGRAGDDLARAAIVAVPKLAAAAGHPVSGVSGASGAGSGGGSSAGSGGGAAAVGAGGLVFVAVLASAAVLSFRQRRARAR